MRTAFAVVAVGTIASVAGAAVVINDGAGTVAGFTNFIDFDSPFVPSGPAAGGVGAGQGFSNFALIGTWTVSGDVINAGSNGSGQTLVSAGNSLGVAGVGGALDNATAGAGYSITLASPATAFSWLFVDQINMGYQVELFSGAASLGTATATYGSGTGTFPFPESQVDAMGASFDRVEITFPTGAGGVGIDNMAYVAVPAPATLALGGLGMLAGARRRR